MRPGRGLLPAAQFIAAVLLAEWVFSLLTPSEPPFSLEHIGSPAARHRMVYAHGFDTFGPNWIEIRNRETLRALARSLGLFIAVPRAPGRAWPCVDAEQAERSGRLLREAADGAFPEGARFGILGFSNAGFMALRLHPDGLPPHTDWVVAVGASGQPLGHGSDAGAAQIPLRLLVGTHDPVHADTLLLGRLLKGRGRDALVADYPGVHQLPFRELRAVLVPLLEGSPR